MLYLILTISTLILGSFLNTVIYRLPLMMNEQEDASLARSAPTPPALNLWLPRSFCPNCKQLITWLSNIPLVSFALQKGKCKACQHPISYQYPFIEAITVFLSLGVAYALGFGWTLLFALAFIGFMLPLCVIDIQHHLLPDTLTLGLLWAGLLANTQQLFCPLPDAVVGAVIGYAALWLVAKCFYWTTGKVGMGQGDIKLFAALGAWFGWSALPFILCASSLLGLIVGVAYLILTRQDKNIPIPFGPFLCFSGFLTILYGENLFNVVNAIITFNFHS